MNSRRGPRIFIFEEWVDKFLSGSHSGNLMKYLQMIEPKYWTLHFHFSLTCIVWTIRPRRPGSQGPSLSACPDCRSACPRPSPEPTPPRPWWRTRLPPAVPRTRSPAQGRVMWWRHNWCLILMICLTSWENSELTPSCCKASIVCSQAVFLIKVAAVVVDRPIAAAPMSVSCRSSLSPRSSILADDPAHNVRTFFISGSESLLSCKFWDTPGLLSPQYKNIKDSSGRGGSWAQTNILCFRFVSRTAWRSQSDWIIWFYAQLGSAQPTGCPDWKLDPPGEIRHHYQASPVLSLVRLIFSRQHSTPEKYFK